MLLFELVEGNLDLVGSDIGLLLAEERGMLGKRK